MFENSYCSKWHFKIHAILENINKQNTELIIPIDYFKIGHQYAEMELVIDSLIVCCIFKMSDGCHG